MPINAKTMSTKLRIQTSIVVLCLSLTATCLQAESSAESALSTLLNQYHTLQANFNEKTLSTDGRVLDATDGDIAFQRPELFRWYTESPSRQLIINKGDKLAIYDIDLDQVTYKNVDEQYGATPALLLSGNIDKLKQHYWIKTCPNIAKDCYQLSAKDDNDVFRQLTLIFNGTVLKSMTIDNNLDQTTQIEFNHVKINSTLPKSLFELNLPSDVDVVQ